MDLANGAHVAIELAPDFAPVHVANIRALVRAGWFDGSAVVRVQDNYVVQWAGASEARPLPAGVVAHPPAEYDRPLAGLALRPLGSPDAYAARVGHADGWPVASDGTRAWLAHCYGMVGVGRDMPPDTGSGVELYGVIGQAPRHLDRNIALVGRIVSGIEALSALPRGTGDLGFYTDPGQRLGIRRIRIAADLPAARTPALRSDAQRLPGLRRLCRCARQSARRLLRAPGAGCRSVQCASTGARPTPSLRTAGRNAGSGPAAITHCPTARSEQSDGYALAGAWRSRTIGRPTGLTGTLRAAGMASTPVAAMAQTASGRRRSDHASHGRPGRSNDAGHRGDRR